TLQGDLDGFTGAILDGVAQQIGDELVEAKLVPSPRKLTANVELDRALRSSRRFFVAGEDLANQRSQIEVVQLELETVQVNLRDVEQPVDQVRQSTDLAVDPRKPPLFDHIALLGRAEHSLHLELKRRQRRAQVVCRDCEELVAKRDRFLDRSLG